MTRYFYEDPLAVLWAAQNLRVKFLKIDLDYGEAGYSFPPDGASGLLWHGEVCPYSIGDEIDIDPRSLHILLSLPDDKKQAMQLLGLWPKQEA